MGFGIPPFGGSFPPSGRDLWERLGGGNTGGSNEGGGKPGSNTTVVHKQSSLFYSYLPRTCQFFAYLALGKLFALLRS